MAQENAAPGTTEKESPKLTKADVAKLVKREVPAVGKEGKSAGKTAKQDISEKEVFDFKVRDDGTVVVVTVDGQKLFGSVK